MKPRITYDDNYTGPTAKMYAFESEPVEGGWVARCEETGLSAFGTTSESAFRALLAKNNKRASG